MSINVINEKIVAFIEWFIGGVDNALLALILIVGINCIMGLLSCVKKRKFSFSTILKQLSILLVVGIANLLDVQLKSGSLLRSLSLSFYLINESLCFFQYLSDIGVYIPDRLLNIISQFTKLDTNDSNTKQD
ncbi:MAG: phage holin family protein [Ruminococcus sp.]|nr:phage holin family protein [Ruminococcus sp.]